MSTARVLVIGEALVDVVRNAGERVVHPGGSPLNVAVGLARLGLPTTLHTSVGDDDHGRLIEAHLAASGVITTSAPAPGSTTSVAEASIAPDGAASYRFDIEWRPAAVGASNFEAVHTGSIGAALEPGATLVEGVLAGARERSTVSFDPNVRPQLMGDVQLARPRVERLVALADVVKASDEDLAWLYPELSPDEVLARWIELGPAFVVVTRGGAGATAVAASGAVQVAAPPTTVSDTIGAGDSFMSGLLAALADRDLLGAANRPRLRAIDGATLEAVVAFAARCAAITVSRPGADPPTRADVR
jgi:fructokinase